MTLRELANEYLESERLVLERAKTLREELSRTRGNIEREALRKRIDLLEDEAMETHFTAMQMLGYDEPESL